MNSKEIVGSVFGVALKVILAVIIVMLVYKYSVTGYEYGYRVFGEEPVSSGEGRTIMVTIPEGESAKGIGTILEEKGLIRDAVLFTIQERISEYHGKIQPGSYELNTAMTAEEMIMVMAQEDSTETEEDTPEPAAEEETSQTEPTIPPETEAE